MVVERVTRTGLPLCGQGGGAGDGPPDQLTVAPGLGVRGGDEIPYVDLFVWPEANALKGLAEQVEEGTPISSGLGRGGLEFGVGWVLLLLLVAACFLSWFAHHSSIISSR